MPLFDGIMTKTKEKTEDKPEGELVQTVNKENPVPETVDETTSQNETEATQAKPKLTLVIPYRSDKAQGKELLFALRSWAKNFLEDGYNVVVIGDLEDWLDKDKIDFIPYDNPSENPQVNMAEIIKLVVASELVADNFILTNDDIYLFRPVTLAHVAVPKYLGLLNPARFKGTYRKNMERTIDLLEKGGKKPLNFASHTPFLFNKERVVETFEKFPELSDGALFSCLYFSLVPETPILTDWKVDNWHVSVVSPNPSRSAVDKYVMNKCFVNNAVSGYSEFLEQLLQRQFPDASPYEL